MGITNLQQGGGTDWSKMTPQFILGTTSVQSSTSPGTIVNVTGKGILTGLILRGQGSTSVNSVRFTIDGVVGSWIESYASAIATIPATHRFNTSLKVEAYNASNGMAIVGVSYNLD